MVSQVQSRGWSRTREAEGVCASGLSWRGGALCIFIYIYREAEEAEEERRTRAQPVLLPSSELTFLPSLLLFFSSEINPTGPLPTLDAEDSYLLSNPDPIQPQPSLSSSNSLDPSGSVPAAPSGGHIDIHSHVSWLRKTEYIQKDAVRATAGVGGLKGSVERNEIREGGKERERES